MGRNSSVNNVDTLIIVTQMLHLTLRYEDKPITKESCRRGLLTIRKPVKELHNAPYSYNWNPRAMPWEHQHDNVSSKRHTRRILVLERYGKVWLVGSTVINRGYTAAHELMGRAPNLREAKKVAVDQALSLRHKWFEAGLTETPNQDTYTP
jgi:hypothetical protein